jgi:hypothetical protein
MLSKLGEANTYLPVIVRKQVTGLLFADDLAANVGINFNLSSVD